MIKSPKTIGDLLKEALELQESKCKGLWYRISKEFHTTERGVSLRFQMRLLKTESCPGCVFCTPIWKILRMKGASTIDNLHLKKHGDKCRLVRRK